MNADKSSVRRFFFSSDKCDFVLRGETHHKPGEELADRTSFEAALRRFRVGVSSDKCDWRVRTDSLVQPAQPGLSSEIALEKGAWRVQADIPGGRMRAASDKCDWRLHVEELVRPADAAALASAPTGFAYELRRRVQSDKCDWQMVAGDAVRKVEASIGKKGLSAAVQGPILEGRMASDKCDWMMKGLGREVSNPPQIEASLSSTKSGYSLQIRFGMAGGRAFRVQGIYAASDKCDFRLKPMEVSDDWTTWRAHADPTPDKGT